MTFTFNHRYRITTNRGVTYEGIYVGEDHAPATGYLSHVFVPSSPRGLVKVYITDGMIEEAEPCAVPSVEAVKDSVSISSKTGTSSRTPSRSASRAKKRTFRTSATSG